MCGINGLMALGKPLPSDTDRVIRGMNRCLQHRGPDDEGVFLDLNQGIALGHRRLSIIDLSDAAHQPMKDEAGSQIVFNGEIYNYREIRKKTGTIYRTESDTEVLMDLYAQKGHAALPELNGMFAFAFYHRGKNELLLARDRAGKKPLYYTELNGIFAFSSEIKALLTLPWIKPETDDHALYDFLTFNQLDPPRTMFKGIYKLGPGECMTVSQKGIVLKEEYWKPEYSDFNSKGESELTDRLFELFDQSVQYRMVADVPVGAFLSGGVDSSAVVALMRKYATGAIKTYSVGFEGQPDYDERIHAHKVAEMFQTEHHEVLISPQDISEFLPRIVEIFDEPMADATAIPIYFISKLARANGSIVVQTGDGADELFAGYRGWKKYRDIYPWYNRVASLPKFIRSGLALVNESGRESRTREIIHRAASGQELFWGSAKAFKEHSKKDFLNKDWLNKSGAVNSYEVVKKYRDEFSLLQKRYPWLNETDWMCYIGFRFQIPSRYLYRMDRLGMSAGIEIRSPFLDYNMVNYALSVPSSLKVKNDEPKYILKKALEKVLPRDILYRKKMGFNVPLREWSAEVMIDYIESNLKTFSSNTGIFREAELRQHIQQLKKGNTGYTNNLWTVYFLMNWMKYWFRV